MKFIPRKLGIGRRTDLEEGEEEKKKCLKRYEEKKIKKIYVYFYVLYKYVYKIEGIGE